MSEDLNETWKALIGTKRDLMKKQEQKKEGEKTSNFKGPQITTEVKWSTHPDSVQETSTEQYIYTQLANVTSKVGLLEMIAENQDSIVRALAKVISRLVELDAIDVNELTELIADYKHRVKG